MTNSFWRPSHDQRRTILLMEALGLIHDLGKMSDRLLQSQDPKLGVEYGHNLLSDPRSIDIYAHFQNIDSDPSAEFVTQILATANNQFCAFGERTDINNLLKRIEFAWIGEQYSFAELMPLLTKTKLSVDGNADWNKILGKSMQPGLLIGYLHGIAHIDKEGDPEQHKQPYRSVFRATPFGYEDQIGTEGVEELTQILHDLPLENIKEIASPNRSKWLNQMMALMKRGLADNRRPHNEISLWDWGYSVATLAKAATNYIFKNRWPSNLRNLPFRTLRVNLDILESYKKSNNIGDLLGVKQVIDNSFREVQKCLEETFALGNQLYQDETGAYYLLPDIFNASEQTELQQEIQFLFPSDLKPKVHFSDSFTADNLHHVKAGNEHSSSEIENHVDKLVAEPRLEALKEKQTTANNIYLFNTE
ncbi:hypothetical protein POG22_17160 [Geitlerinema sp. CS-897]|nr:hypothetical protein [Geitlerinema sp. CS-897]